MKPNVKTICITVPNEAILKRLNSTPTLRNATRLSLKVGDNIERVNHFQFSKMMRMYPLVGCEIKEI